MRNINPIFVLIFLLLSFVPVAAQRKNVDLIISGGTIVTVDKQNRVIENGAIAIRGTNIVGVDSASAIARQFISRKTIFANGKVIIPGLINTHTHVPMTLFRGIADDLDLQDWLTKYIFPAEAKNVNEEFVRAGTRLGLAEMIRGGTTTYCDMYYFEDAIAEETSKAGVRGVLGETLIDFPVPDNKTFAEALMGAEADAVCGAEYRSRDEGRTNRRNGYRLREWDTRAGVLEGMSSPAACPRDVAAPTRPATRLIRDSPGTHAHDEGASTWSKVTARRSA